MAIGEQIDLMSIARGDRSMQQLGDAIGGYYTRERQRRDLEDNRAYAEEMQGRQFEQAKAIQEMRNQALLKNVEAQEANYKRRELERRVRELSELGYPPTAAERKALDAGDISYIERATNEAIEDVGGRMEDLDGKRARLKSQGEENARGLEQDKAAWVNKRAQEKLLQQLKPEQIADIKKKHAGLVRTGQAKSLATMIEEYGLAKVDNFIPLDQFRPEAEVEFDEMPKNPYKEARLATARALQNDYEALGEERATLFARNPFAQPAQMRIQKRKSKSAVSEMDALTLQDQGDVGGVLGAGEYPKQPGAAAALAPVVVAPAVNPAFNPEIFASTQLQPPITPQDVAAGRLRRDVMMKVRGMDAMSVLGAGARPSKYKRQSPFSSFDGQARIPQPRVARPDEVVNQEAQMRLVEELIRDPGIAAKLGIQIDPSDAQKALEMFY